MPMIKEKVSNELNTYLSFKFDSSVGVWKISDLMREFKLEMEARGRIGYIKRTKSKRESTETILGLLSITEITCLLCRHQQCNSKCQYKK